MHSDQSNPFFQDFSNSSQGLGDPERLNKLRHLMAENDLDVWLVPHGDEYQNEYPAPYAARLSWLTGFTGSAGFCIVTKDEAIVFTDGRYTLQVRDQINETSFRPDDLIANPPHKWLAKWLNERAPSAIVNVGYDSNLISQKARETYLKHLSSERVNLVSHENLIDQIWHDQPNIPLEPVTIQPEKFSGKLAMQKIDELKSQISQNADYCLLTDPASIAWAFNIRGGDTPHTPLALGYAIISTQDFPSLFMDKRKMSREVEAYLTQLANLLPPSQLNEELAKLAPDNTFQIDEARVSSLHCDIIIANGGKISSNADPIILPRAIKNTAEIEGSHNAHLRDGVALTKFLCWLDEQEPGSLTEIDAAKSLENFRRETAPKFQSELMDLAFDTISGAGANGAIVHYRVTENTNAILQDNSLYLVDSGAQYSDGTTDITRTIAIGQPPTLAIEDFTLVLKGHIAIARARFPEGTRGVDIDGLARNALWQHGRDYAHGTGHGIGAYLAVHEGPQSISKRGMVELSPGMIISNEPGFYREGKYGIRIENLVLVKDAVDFEDGNIPVMGFETLSLAPIDLRLIDPSIMSDDERYWLNAYHGWVKRTLSPHLEEGEATWLEKATHPISLELPAASA